VLLLLLMVRPDWNVINAPHLVLLLLCSSPSAVAAVDDEILLGYDLFLT
jgi:hypothetical protein